MDRDEHLRELERRSTVAREGASSGAQFARVEGIGDDPPFVHPEQAWALFSTSHVGMAPRAVDPRQPALRLYGCFSL